MALGGLAAVFAIYGKDLPDYAQLENYEPATLSRIYSGQGPAHGRVRPRAADLHADRRDPRPGEGGVHLGRGQELLRAPRLRSARHRGGALRRGGAWRPAARRLDDHPAGDEELPPDRRPLRRAQDQGDHPRHAAREHALQERDPPALPQRDLPRPELLRRHRGGADLLRQVAGAADARRDRLSRGAAAGAERAASGAREGARDRPAQLRARSDGGQRLRHPRRGRRGARPRICSRCSAAPSPRPAARCRRATISPTRSGGSFRRSSATRSSSPAA